MMKSLQGTNPPIIKAGSLEPIQPSEIEAAIIHLQDNEHFSNILHLLELSKKILLAKNALLTEAVSGKYENEIKVFEAFPTTWVKCRRLQIFLQATRFPEIHPKNAKKLAREQIALLGALKAQDPLESPSIEHLVR